MNAPDRQALGRGPVPAGPDEWSDGRPEGRPDGRPEGMPDGHPRPPLSVVPGSLPPPVPPAPLDTHRSDRGARLWGLLAVLVVFGGVGGWAALAPLSSAAIGQGVVAVENYRKPVQHLEGGIVRRIEVRDGQTVQRDQVLIVMDNIQAQAQLEVLRGQSYSLLAREARLVAQRGGQARPAYAAELTRVRSDARAADAMRVQDQTLAAQQQALAGEITLYERQIQQLRARATGLEAQRASREALVQSFDSERRDFEALVQQGYAERQRLREMERNLAQNEGQRGALVSDLAATELQVNEIQVKILQLGREAQRDVAKELAEVHNELNAVRERMRAVSDTEARTAVRAPEAGTVLGLAVHSVGAVVRPGERIMDIVPQGERLLIDVKLSPQDIDQVRIGQVAEVRLPSVTARALARLEGRLVAVSADRLVDNANGVQTAYYLARVELTPAAVQALGQAQLALLPGMPAEVLVNTGERTVWQYLVAPMKDTLARSFKQP